MKSPNALSEDYISYAPLNTFIMHGGCFAQGGELTFDHSVQKRRHAGIIIQSNETQREPHEGGTSSFSSGMTPEMAELGQRGDAWLLAYLCTSTIVTS